MFDVANISPQLSGMRNNTIKMHFALHIMVFLTWSTPRIHNFAHIPLAMNTSRNTQKHVASLPQQAAQWYHEHSAILVAFGDLEFEAEPQTPVTLSGPAGSW